MTEVIPKSGEPARLDQPGFRGRLIAMVAGLVTACVFALGVVAAGVFDRAIEPELNNRTRLIGSIVRAEIQNVVELGIAIGAVAGLDGYLNDTLAKFDEVDRITVVSSKGEPVATATRAHEVSGAETAGFGAVFAIEPTTFELPILVRNELAGMIVVETNPLFVQTQLRGVFLDVLVLALIAALVALELSLAVAMTSVGKPLERLLSLLREQGAGNFVHTVRAVGIGGLARTASRLNDHAEDLADRARRLTEAARRRIGASVAADRPVGLRLSDFNDIRLALFLFSIATEIAVAFLPIYSTAVSRPESISPELAAAAPLIVYLAAVAALSPFGGTLSKMLGPRRLFVWSVPPAALALAAMGLADSLAAIVFWRAVMAVFYATATIACQEYAIRAAGEREAARSVGAFVTVVYGGVFCGSALGGILAGRFGFDAALIAGAAIAGLAGVFGAMTMRGDAGDPTRRAPKSDKEASPQGERRPGLRFVAVLVGIAIPMNAAAAIFIWYLTPLMLAAAGSGPAEIGRVVMLYYLSIVLLSPTAARLADKNPGPVPVVLAGGALSALALLSLSAWSGFWPVTLAVLGTGVGHGLIRAPQYGLALRSGGGSGSSVGLLRLGERVGAILGLAGSVLMLGAYGAEASIAALGSAVLAGTLLFAIVELKRRQQRR